MECFSDESAGAREPFRMPRITGGKSPRLAVAVHLTKMPVRPGPKRPLCIPPDGSPCHSEFLDSQGGDTSVPNRGDSKSCGDCST